MLGKGDIIRVNDLFHTIPYFGLDDQGKMLQCVGKELKIDAADSQSVRVKKFLFHINDIEVIKSNTPEWVIKLVSMCRPSQCEHRRNYALTSNPKLETLQQCINHSRDCQINGSGFCFESFGSDREIFQANFRQDPKFLIWRFSLGAVGIETQYSFLSEAQKAKLLDDDVDIDKMATEGHMRIRLTNGKKNRSTNIVYVSTCLGRYMYEKPDTIRGTMYLNKNIGMDFLTAFVLTELMYGGRSHHLISRNVFDYSSCLSTDIPAMTAQIACMLYNWAEKKEDEQCSSTFRWWSSLSRYCPKRKVLTNAAKLKYKDLVNFNPKTGGIKVK